MERPLGKVLLGFKQGCNKAYRRVMSAAVVQQQTEQQQTEWGQTNEQQPAGLRGRQDRRHGLLFEPSFNDRLLLREGQLERWLAYADEGRIGSTGKNLS